MDEVEKSLREIIYALFPLKNEILSIKDTDDLQNAGIDSVSYLTLLITVEDKFDILVPPEKMNYMDLNTIRKFCILIKELKML